MCAKIVAACTRSGDTFPDILFVVFREMPVLERVREPIASEVDDIPFQERFKKFKEEHDARMAARSVDTNVTSRVNVTPENSSDSVTSQTTTLSSAEQPIHKPMEKPRVQKRKSPQARRPLPETMTSRDEKQQPTQTTMHDFFGATVDARKQVRACARV